VTGRFEILEHTADVGLRLTAETLPELFEAAGEGLATLQDAWNPGKGREVTVDVSADDRAALLAAWLDELLFLSEREDGVFGGFRVEHVGDEVLRATVWLEPSKDPREGVGIKAATYHRLRLEQEPNGGWSADVYLDV
jgi:SHS2 domain-containing protein